MTQPPPVGPVSVQPAAKVKLPWSDSRRWSRLMFHLHLWIGIMLTAILIVISITGILLNHKRGLGLMPDVPHTPSGPLTQALSISELAQAAERTAGPAVATAGIDRMDVRPGDGVVKVRFNDALVTEVDLDLVTGQVVVSEPRNDVFLEKLHSAEILGKRWVLVSDIAAAGLLLLLASGVWIWLYPKSRL